MTPLMLASIRGIGGGEMGMNEDEQFGEETATSEGSDGIIADLILHGASLKAKTKSAGMQVISDASRLKAFRSYMHFIAANI